MLPAHRGQGIATAMVLWCETLAADRGIREARLGVRHGLERDRAMYARLGYVVCGELVRDGYGPIAAWMCKRLG